MRFLGKQLGFVLAGMLLMSFTTAVTQPRRASVDNNLKILQTSTDREALERAAVAMISSGDSTAVARLGEFLRRSEFLARLDDLRNSNTKTLHLSKVMAALKTHPSPAVGQLCLTLSKDKNFTADDDHMDLLLETLSAVRPMTAEGADLFRRTNAEGYFAFNAPLLVKNGSPRSLELFESMMKDRNVNLNRRVDCLHRSLLPHRASLPVLNSAERLLSADLEEPIAIGLIESIFDYQSKRWFGPTIAAPRPPLWERANNNALQAVLRLAAKAKSRGYLPPTLIAAVNDTVTTIQKILTSRRP